MLVPQWLGVFEGEGFGFRFAQGGPGIQINTPTRDGRLVRIRLETRYVPIGDADPFPAAFRANVLGDADSINDVIDRFWQAVVLLLPPLSVAANANIQELNLLAAVEISDQPENEMFHRAWPPQSLIMRQMKVLPEGRHLLNVLDSTMAPPDADWLHRATLQYSTALDYWRPGQELFAVQHFFMAAEVLSRVLVQRQLTLTQYGRDQLAKSWGVKRKELEFHIRATTVFADEDLAQEVEAISNGLEHGYETVPQLQRAAARVRDDVCRCVRTAILSALDLEPSARATFLSPAYAMPARTDRAGSALAGRFLAGTTRLQDGLQIPFLTINLDDVSFNENPAGGYSMSMSHTGTVVSLPEGLSFQIERVAYSGPIESVGETVVE